MSQSRISITTVCTPWLTLEELLPKLKAAGYGSVEIALTERKWNPNEEPNPWKNNGATIDWSASDDELAALRAQIDELGLEVSCIGSYVGTDDIDRIARSVEVARALGSEFIRVRVPWYKPGTHYRTELENARACFRDLALISQETGVDSLIEIHDNSICCSASGAMRVLEGLDPSLVGVIYDPGNFLNEGLESIPMTIDILGDYLRHVHIKDATVARAEEFNKHGVRLSSSRCTLGEGDLDWGLIMKLLGERGYDGYFSIENFAPTDDPEGRLATDATWLSQLLAATTQPS